MNVLMTEETFQAISDAVVEGKRRSMELGGSIAALETKDQLIVAYAVPTGPQADQSYAHLRTDADYQNDALAAIRSQIPELTYVGDWHVHPMWLPTLSGTDSHTAERILREEGASRSSLLLLLGTVAPPADPVVIGFIARLNGSGTVRIDEVPIKLITRDSDVVLAHFGRKLPPLEELLSKTNAARTLVHHRGANRILEDLETIRTDLHAETTSWGSGDMLGAVVRRGKREAFVLFPPEYPFGAPQVFAGSLARGPLRPIPLRFGWSSLHCLTDVVEIALRPPVRRALPTEPSTFGSFMANALSWVGFPVRQTDIRALATNATVNGSNKEARP